MLEADVLSQSRTFPESDSERSSLVIAAAQSASIAGDIPWNVAHHLQFATLAAERGVQLLVFPELSLIGYELAIARSKAVSPQDTELGPLRHFAAQARMTIVAGAPVLNPENRRHIAAIAFRPDESTVTYTKQHVHHSEAAVFTSGPGGPTMAVGDATAALAICADAKHPAHAAGAAARGATIYAAGVMITDDEYPLKATLLQSYAREHRMAVLLANYSGMTGGLVSAGRSAIWSEDGELVAASTGAEETLLIGTRQRGVWEAISVPLAQGISA
jgi:predicted amidohydrolase